MDQGKLEDPKADSATADSASMRQQMHAGTHADAAGAATLAAAADAFASHAPGGGPAGMEASAQGGSAGGADEASQTGDSKVLAARAMFEGTLLNSPVRL